MQICGFKGCISREGQNCRTSCQNCSSGRNEWIPGDSHRLAEARLQRLTTLGPVLLSPPPVSKLALPSQSSSVFSCGLTSEPVSGLVNLPLILPESRLCSRASKPWSNEPPSVLGLITLDVGISERSHCADASDFRLSRPDPKPGAAHQIRVLTEAEWPLA